MKILPIPIRERVSGYHCPQSDDKRAARMAVRFEQKDIIDWFHFCEVLMRCLKGRAAIAFAAVLFSGAALAQGPGFYAPGREPGVDLSGNWGPVFHEDGVERGPGPELVNYLGIPINEGARLAGLSYDASRFTLPEHQCEVHILSYIYRGPLNVRIWEERDPVTQDLIAIKQYIDNYEQSRTIWMDGREHPGDAAAHTWMGFSTGKWDGGVLTVYTTHLKRGWIRRNGLRQSDQATVVEHFIRHGDHLTHVSIVTDPLSLTEPFIRSQDFLLRGQNGEAWIYPCEPVVEIDRPRGAVPNYLPGENPFIHEFADKFNIPVEAALGGAETLYPEYQLKLKQMSAAAGKK